MLECQKASFVIFIFDTNANYAEATECNGVHVKAQCVADRWKNSVYVGLTKAME